MLSFKNVYIFFFLLLSLERRKKSNRQKRTCAYCARTTLLFVLFFLLFFNSRIEAFSKIRVYSPIHIISEQKDFEFYRIKSFLINTEGIVSNSLGQPILGKCNIYLKDNLEKEIKIWKTKNGVLNIYLSKNYFFLINSRKVSQHLLRAFILSSLGIPFTQENVENITWLVDALNRKLNKLTFPKIYPDEGSFPGIHFLLLSGYKLTPGIIINNSTTSSDERIIYKFNSEASEILLDTILSLKNGKKFLSEYLKEVCSGKKNNMDIFYSVLCENLSLSKKESKKFFIKHLNDTAFKFSVNPFMPASPKYVVNVFNSACIVSYNSKNNPNTIKECSLEDLLNVWDDIDSPIKLVQKLEAKFKNLRSYSPFLLQQPINRIIMSLYRIEPKKKPEAFKNDILQYKKSFRKAVNREIELQILLQKEEEKSVSAFMLYHYYFQVIDINNRYLEELWPELNVYLEDQF